MDILLHQPVDTGRGCDEKRGSFYGFYEYIKRDFLHHAGSGQGAHLFRPQPEQGDLPSFLGLYIGTYLACQYQDDPKAFLGSAVYEAAGGIAAYMGAGYEVGFLALVKIIPEGIIVL